MKGEQEVIDMLRKMLTAELTAHNLYFVQYQMIENWGYKKLAEHVKKDAELELHHANEIIERTLFYDAVPDMNKIDPIKVGADTEEQLRIQYDFETNHVKDVKDYIKLCIDKKDFGTKELLDEILQESEEQIDWLETQFNRIKDIGIKNYLMEHMHE